MKHSLASGSARAATAFAYFALVAFGDASVASASTPAQFSSPSASVAHRTRDKVTSGAFRRALEKSVRDLSDPRVAARLLSTPKERFAKAPSAGLSNGQKPILLRDARVRVRILKDTVVRKDGDFDTKTTVVCDQYTSLHVWDVRHMDDPSDVSVGGEFPYRIQCPTRIPGLSKPVTIALGGELTIDAWDVWAPVDTVGRGPFPEEFKMVSLYFAATFGPGDFPDTPDAYKRLPPGAHSFSGDYNESTKTLHSLVGYNDFHCSSSPTDPVKPSPVLSPGSQESVGEEPVKSPAKCTSRYPVSFSAIVQVEDRP